MNRVYSFFLFLLGAGNLYGQNINFLPGDLNTSTALTAHFHEFSTGLVSLPNLYKQVVSSSSLDLSANGKQWNFDLREDPLLSPNYFATEKGANLPLIHRDISTRTYSGFLERESGSIVITIDKYFFQAMIVSGTETYFIELMNPDGRFNTDGNLIWYNTKAIIPGEKFSCGVTDMMEKEGALEDGLEARTNGCKVAEIAIATDATMYTKYSSSIPNVQNHNIAVLNNVRFNYRHEFGDNIEFSLVTQYVSTTYANDPLSPNTTSTNAVTLLNAFTAWGSGGGFGVTHDIGEFWTNRNFDGATVGLAWLDAVCTNYKYHILQDFTTNADNLRVMTAHEMGHNFNADHDADGSPYIMAPIVSTSNIWSSTSVTAISSHINSRTCLAGCSGTLLPNFVYSPAALCGSGTVLFRDKSANSSSRTWTFTGGSPGSSTAQQPAISYNTTGNYDVKIDLGGGASKTLLNAVTVGSEPYFNFNSCAAPSGTPGSLGPRLFSLSDLYNPSGTASVDGARYMNFICSDLASLEFGKTYTFSTTVGNCSSSKYEQIRLYIDYNNDGDFNDSGELVYTSGGGGYCGTVTDNFVTPSSGVPTNTIIRARLITNNANITGPCYNPSQGQTEDYGVIFKHVDVLPVDLLAFEGNGLRGVNVLSWKTVNEIGVAKYIIERSTDGNEFFEIGFNNAKNSTEIQKYVFNDSQLSEASPGYYYRLKIRATDGNIKYSNIIFLNQKSSFEVIKYNSLITQDFQLTLSNGQIDHYLLSLSDLTGKVILADQVDLQPGINELKYKMDFLSAGLYIFQIRDKEGKVVNLKLIKN